MNSPVDEHTRTLFRQFVSDEASAIDQLRQFIGGQLTQALDLSIESLSLLDHFVANLTRHPDWATSSLFADYSKNIRPWLSVRLAYYLAACLRARMGGEWRLSEQKASPFYGTPVFRIRGSEISPLEIANSYLDGKVTGGLSAVAAAIDREVRTV